MDIFDANFAGYDQKSLYSFGARKYIFCPKKAN